MKYEHVTIKDFSAVIRKAWTQRDYTALRDEESRSGSPSEYGSSLEQLDTSGPPPEVVKPADEEVPMIETIKLATVHYSSVPGKLGD
ncbi:hypothetical protein CJJ09_002015 [Candidozyma auris]|nr:hypothetical protein CJJ09_002015 [[Candida] auris]